MYARPRCPWLLVTALLLSGRSLALKMYLYDLPSSLVKPPCEVMHNYHLEEALPRFLAMPSSPTRTSDASNADFFVVPATPYCRQTEADMEVRVTLSLTESLTCGPAFILENPKRCSPLRVVLHSSWRNPESPFARAPGIHPGGAAETARAAVVAAARRR